MKKYSYRSAVGSSVVVRESKQHTNNEITSILDTNHGLLFINGKVNKGKIFEIEISKEFYSGENISIDQCIDYLISEHDYNLIDNVIVELVQ